MSVDSGVAAKLKQSWGSFRTLLYWSLTIERSILPHNKGDRGTSTQVVYLTRESLRALARVNYHAIRFEHFGVFKEKSELLAIGVRPFTLSGRDGTDGPKGQSSASSVGCIER